MSETNWSFELCSAHRRPVRYWIEVAALDTGEVMIKGPPRATPRAARRAVLAKIERVAVALIRDWARIAIGVELADLRGVA